MNVTLDIKCPELAQAINNLAAAIAGRQDNASTYAEHFPEPEKSKPTRAPRAAKTEPTEPSTPPTSEETATADTSDTASGEENAGSADAPTVDYADIKKAVVALATGKGREAVVTILTKYGVPEGGKADQVEEAKWPALLADLTEAAK